MRGDEMRNLRKHAGLSQEKLAKALGISQGYVGELERGDKTIDKRTELAVRYVAGVRYPGEEVPSRFLRHKLSEIKELALAAAHLTGVPDFGIIATYAEQALTAKLISNIDDHIGILSSSQPSSNS